MVENNLKNRLRAGETSYVFSVRMARTMNIVAMAEAVGYHGFYVDLQHSSISIDTAAQIFQTALHTSVTAFVRVPSLEPGLISRLLDAGAQGILAPDVRSADQAQALVRAALIAPRGDRSVGASIPNPKFKGLFGAALASAMNDATLLIAMIETEDAAERADEIIAVDGIDAILIGSNDLTNSMGIPGQFTDERVQAVYGKVIAASRKAGKPQLIGGMRNAEHFQQYDRKRAAR